MGPVKNSKAGKGKKETIKIVFLGDGRRGLERETRIDSGRERGTRNGGEGSGEVKSGRLGKNRKYFRLIGPNKKWTLEGGGQEAVSRRIGGKNKRPVKIVFSACEGQERERDDSEKNREKRHPESGGGG